MTWLNKMLTREAATKRYGEIDLTSGHWEDSAKWIKMFEVPAGAFPNWKVLQTQIPVTHIAANLDMHRPLNLALTNLINRGLANELRTFDGCWNIRLVRGGAQLSAHSYGLAIDINAAENPLGGPVTLSQEFLQCFADVGFDLGAHFHRIDGMHQSFCWEGPRSA